MKRRTRRLLRRMITNSSDSTSVFSANKLLLFAMPFFISSIGKSMFLVVEDLLISSGLGTVAVENVEEDELVVIEEVAVVVEFVVVVDFVVVVIVLDVVVVVVVIAVVVVVIVVVVDGASFI